MLWENLQRDFRSGVCGRGELLRGVGAYQLACPFWCRCVHQVTRLSTLFVVKVWSRSRSPASAGSSAGR